MDHVVQATAGARSQQFSPCERARILTCATCHSHVSDSLRVPQAALQGATTWWSRISSVGTGHGVPATPPAECVGVLTLLQCEAASLEVLVIEDVKNKMTQLGDALYHYIEKVRLAAEQQRIAAAALEAERAERVAEDARIERETAAAFERERTEREAETAAIRMRLDDAEAVAQNASDLATLAYHSAQMVPPPAPRLPPAPLQSPPPLNPQRRVPLSPVILVNGQRRLPVRRRDCPPVAVRAADAAAHPVAAPPSPPAVPAPPSPAVPAPPPPAADVPVAGVPQRDAQPVGAAQPEQPPQRQQPEESESRDQSELRDEPEAVERRRRRHKKSQNTQGARRGRKSKDETRTCACVGVDRDSSRTRYH